MDEVYVLGINGETEAVFNAGGSIKFFNINAARPFGSNETICRQTLVNLLYSTGVNTIYLNTKYKFTAKERDVETGYDYFACLPESERRRQGARYYDSRIARWLQVDPLAEKYFGWSPYNYTLNNPVTYFDPDGKVVWGPGAFAAAVAVLEAIGWATIGTGIVISAVDPENTGKVIIETGEWIQKQSSNLINLIPDLSITPTPFPITQGEGIKQTTIAPSDVTSVSQNLETLLNQGVTIPATLQEQSITIGKTVEAKYRGEKVGVQTHIEIVSGNIHIQIAGSKTKRKIDPTKPIQEQVEGFVKGSKGNINKIIENVEKGIKKLEELNK